MRRVIDNDWLTIAFRLFVGISFIYASFYKIIEPALFARSIWYYHMVPGELINPMALLLPWVELIVGVCLILGVYYRGAVLLVNLMVIMFMIALISAAVRGIDIDCGCFKPGKKSSESALKTLWFDLALLVMTVQLWFSRSRRWMLGKP